MSSKFVVGTVAAIAVFFSTAALAQGTASEAKAMLEKAVAALNGTKQRRWI